jgi:hypothetical protein
VWGHLKPKVTSTAHTKSQSNAKYLTKLGTAADSDKLDGSGPLATTGKAADADTLDGVNAADLPAKPDVTPHIVGEAGEPGFNVGSNGIDDHVTCWWAPFDPVNHASPGFYEDPDGMVHLQGLARATDGSFPNVCGTDPDSTIFTLPEGSRPAYIRTFLVLSNDARARINVFPDGKVRMVAVLASSWANAESWLSLEGIEFRAAPHL